MLLREFATLQCWVFLHTWRHLHPLRARWDGFFQDSLWSLVVFPNSLTQEGMSAFHHSQRNRKTIRFRPKVPIGFPPRVDSRMMFHCQEQSFPSLFYLYVNCQRSIVIALLGLSKPCLAFTSHIIPYLTAVCKGGSKLFWNWLGWRGSNPHPTV